MESLGVEVGEKTRRPTRRAAGNSQPPPKTVTPGEHPHAGGNPGPAAGDPRGSAARSTGPRDEPGGPRASARGHAARAPLGGADTESPRGPSTDHRAPPR